MDEAGLDVQVISLTSPGLHNLPANEATRLQVETNDRIAELVNADPDRFQGFATLATPAPAAAAQELERAVTKIRAKGTSALVNASQGPSQPSRLTRVRLGFHKTRDPTYAWEASMEVSGDGGQRLAGAVVTHRHDTRRPSRVLRATSREAPPPHRTLRPRPTNRRITARPAGPPRRAHRSRRKTSCCSATTTPVTNGGSLPIHKASSRTSSEASHQGRAGPPRQPRIGAVPRLRQLELFPKCTLPSPIAGRPLRRPRAARIP
jgi:hypothetical protein